MKVFLKTLATVYAVILVGVGVWVIDTYVWGTARAVLFYLFWLVIVPAFIGLLALAVHEYNKAQQAYIDKNFGGRY